MHSGKDRTESRMTRPCNFRALSGSAGFSRHARGGLCRALRVALGFKDAILCDLIAFKCVVVVFLLDLVSIH